MKLWYTPTSCGAASFMAAFAGGLQLESEQVDLATHKTASGADFYAINPKGNVPALHLDGAALAGTPQQLLNENVAVLTYLGDAAGANTAVRLCPPEGSPLRYALLNRLGFLASELHKAFGPVFGPLNAAAKQRQKEIICSKLSYLATQEPPHPWLLGETPSVADLYAYVILSWAPMAGIDLAAQFPALKQFTDKVEALPFFKPAQEAMRRAAAGGDAAKAPQQAAASSSAAGVART